MNNVLDTLSNERSSVMVAFAGVVPSSFMLFQNILMLPYPLAVQVKCAPNGLDAVVLVGCFMIRGAGTTISNKIVRMYQQEFLVTYLYTYTI